jgi:hypothetical protein
VEKAEESVEDPFLNFAGHRFALIWPEMVLPRDAGPGPGVQDGR